MGNRVIEASDFRQSAAKHDNVRVKKIDGACERPRKARRIARYGLLGLVVIFFGTPGDILGNRLFTAHRLIVTRQCGAVQPGFDTSRLAASAFRFRAVGRLAPRQRVMAPFTRSGVCAGDDLAIISYGAYVHVAMRVADRLSADGIDATRAFLRSALACCRIGPLRDFTALSHIRLGVGTRPREGCPSPLVRAVFPT